MKNVVLILVLAFGLVGTVAHAEVKNQVYSCELGGSSATYKRAEIDAIISAGGKCAPLSVRNTVTCAVGKVRRKYAQTDISIVLKENPNAVCQENDKLIVKSKSGTVQKKHRVANILYVYFKLNKSEPTPLNRQAVVDFAKRNAKSGAWFTITAYTDRSGGQRYNQVLSTRRAGAVKVELLKNGIGRSEIISVSSMGENAPPIATKDGKRKASNRVVIVRAYR